MSNSPIRVLLVDDHLVMRRGLTTLLLAFHDMVLAGEAQTGAEALSLCAECQPDVVLLDLFLPDIDSAAAIRSIRERVPASQVLVLVSVPVHELLQRAMAAGAVGYLLTNTSASELAAAIRRARDCHPTPAPTSFEDIAPTMLIDASASACQCTDLTGREHDVLALMAHGLTNTQIGACLAISRATVKFHVSSILSKLGATSRTRAVALAVHNHLTSAQSALRAAELVGDFR
jgi:two-component system, NarL family, response regulator LiaR